MAISDVIGRPLRSLRVSVTDRCNLRCQYCMPEEEYVWLKREDILSFEEIGALTDVFVALGVDKIRLTGGEPLLRRGLPTLVSQLAARSGIRDLALTTNGVALADQAAALHAAGLHRITVSLDTLRPERFKALAKRTSHDAVLAGIKVLAPLGFREIKINAVIVRGLNDDELFDLVEMGKAQSAQIRFIEYMDVGGATHWSPDRVVSKREILATLSRHYGKIEPIPQQGSAPADEFRLSDGTTLGIISSTTEPFCRSCDRSRLTADGLWYMCLYAPRGLDLRGALRGGAGPDELLALIRGRWTARIDRGAEERLGLTGRSALADSGELRADPHLEMHTRGG